MWCANCRADVAAEVAVDNRRIRCATCGAEIIPDNPLPTTAKTREARDLLERWTSEKLLEPPDSAAARSNPENPGLPPSSASLKSPSSGGERPHPPLDDRPGDRQEPADSGVGHAQNLLDQGKRARRGDKSRLHAAHTGGAVSPHFNVQAAAHEKQQRTGNWSAFVGPILAYAGVGVLTIGTCLVLFGYFGGPENARYAPTGWLVTTAGQMLLFLGVVTLVSGGMEQTTEEVARRIETLGERMLRIEQASSGHALKGPSIAASRFVASAVGPESPSLSPALSAAAAADSSRAAQATNAK